MTRARLFRLTREVLLTSSAVLGALCVVLTALAFALGIHPLMFRSGSMSPTIDTGDIAFARTVDAQGLHRGDIVSLVAPSGERVTHRVVDNTGTGTHRKLTLQGDANRVADPLAYDATKVQKVFLRVPKVGYAVNWLSHAPGVYLVAGYVALMLLMIGRNDRPEGSVPPGGGGSRSGTPDEEPVAPATSSGKRRRTRSRAVLASGGVVASMLVALSAWSMPTWAAWTDNVVVTGQSLTTGSWSVTPVVTCTSGNSIVTMKWDAITGATGYVLHYGASGGTLENVGSATLTKVFNTVGQTGTFTVQAVLSGGNSPSSNAKNYTIGSGVGNTSCTNGP